MRDCWFVHTVKIRAQLDIGERIALGKLDRVKYMCLPAFGERICERGQKYASIPEKFKKLA
ncbi:MAG: hypothetical protein KKI07_04440 [Euryarchaeota archaeon]|nr:hypothetical protein [Euryarchaeota archaeon]